MKTQLQQKNRTEKKIQKNIWPFNVNSEANFTIGEVVSKIEKNFINISISKLRLLESNNLISPKRSSNGYRLYSLQDMVRIEFILTAQRDYFWPIEIIKKRLHQLDEGEIEASELIAGYKPSNIKINYETKIYDNITIDDLSNLTNIDIDEIEDILIKTKNNIHDVRNKPKNFISFFRKYKLLKKKGLTSEHLKIILRNIMRNNDILGLIDNKNSDSENNLNEKILFQNVAMSILKND